MNRREVLRWLACGAVVPLAQPNLMAMLRQARAAVEVPAAARTLNPHQFATVRTMAELILPRTDTPGATDVGTAEFIDLVLTDWYEDREKALFLSGIADVDVQTKATFGRDFVDCSGPQQRECLTVLGEKMVEDMERLRHGPRGYRGEAPIPEASFYAMFRRLTLTAYYTSEAGATQALGFQIIPDRHAGCVEVGASGTKRESQ
jgi:hypothetical protein